MLLMYYKRIICIICIIKPVMILHNNNITYIINYENILYRLYI